MMTNSTTTEHGDRVLDAFANAPEQQRTTLWAKYENAWRAATLMRAGVVTRDGLTPDGLAALGQLGQALGIEPPQGETPSASPRPASRKGTGPPIPPEKRGNDHAKKEDQDD